MSVIAANTPLSISEVEKREGYDDAASVMGDLQNILNFLDEVPWLPTTHGMYNRQLQAKRLGKGAFSEVNGPVPRISSSTDLLEEPVKMYEGDSPVDERLISGAKDPYKARDSEDVLNLEGAIQDWLYLLFYGSETKGFLSLAARRATINGKNCLDYGGSGADLTDMWLFEMGRSGFHLGYPPNSGPPGMKNQDRGRHYIPTPLNDGMMWAWIRHYEIWAAIVLRKDNALQRHANIESAGNFSADQAKIFLKGKAFLPRAGEGAVAFANRTLKGQIDGLAYNQVNVMFKVREIQNYGPITMIGGVPLRMHEGIPDTISEVL